ncbi:N-acetyl-gamma-glutamyl-phosphate reductase [Pseudoalteromonas sp. SR43-6]|jgi:N-acetyl-gamma-glutamyl-phosphate reductase|uniref:N-acetyl-gamma-glutamyl-phosphate reductase n=2 Tax=Pseudoalteromonas TaxID=53246 RepID=UPI00041BCDAF|nr:MULTISPECIES: N-acetyl-gamma-glutamyl-phosphate reductase [Pseudoalteromonas]MBA6409788.1 N-acetyl-gamma-glutamyl-phosphate reductase [Pseudoalteromonas sp. 5Ae-yellow]MBB1278252.1 N-acetyl-gamma-glutamyl-phosphate reductase [Pseudoalteromonas sp. SR43-3]MBB1279326.1 N-acetyl-gamma-glutamyl-phosphate reductase [Pseudoalteromonas sp. SR41-1]MBB1288713.1 N-acetyl-gamma-glutamyl-phosphate reductase [Pseudoalteromonas sp. SR41-5]MBB1296005.1 N-acetyl-gamma-glutamyl-phosphate reductase [Pseudoal|tara:strand:- start:4881 stop:5891 length:1011 start_codon:yes stop_codon:yes gene_type:complete
MNVVIIGASGYSGAELASLVAKHPNLTLTGCYVSEGSLDKNKLLSDLYPEHLGLLDCPLLPLSVSAFDDIQSDADYVCLCTDHKVSVDLAPQFLAMGKKVFDLSGGYRLASNDDYVTYYGFEHQHPELLNEAAYGLAEWNHDAIANAKLIAVAGCYPTAALNALKPLKQAGLLSSESIIINAVSGVTGAGRKASVGTHFCEVSLAPYGLFNHRHGPEIEQHLGHKVLFTPHLGNFPRGILETIYVQLKPGVTKENVASAYQVLSSEPLIRLLGDKVPSIKGVAKQPFVDIGWQQQGTQLIVMSAIDNLLKGAAGQALQCINISMNLDHTTGLKGAF